MPFLASRHSLTGVLSSLCLLGVGCSSDGKPQTDSDKNFQALTILYGKFIPRNRGVGPASEAEFKKFIHSLAASEVEGTGADPANIDKLFVSPRDNQPYVIAYKVRPSPGPDGPPAIIWEQTGVGGKRLVGDALGKVEELDQAAFEKRVGAADKAK